MRNEALYAEVAAVINRERRAETLHAMFVDDRNCYLRIAHRFADKFANEDPDFNRDGFIKACGFEQTKSGL